MAANQRLKEKEIEGDQLVIKGDKLAQTSFFKWKADWEGAADEYEKAATCYKLAKNLVKAKEAWKKAAIAYQHLHEEFSSARCLESAALNAKESQSMNEACELYLQASQLLISQQQNQRAAENRLHAARCAESFDNDLAVKYYHLTIDLLIADNKEHFIADAFKYALAFTLRGKRWEDSLALLKIVEPVYTNMGSSYSGEVYKICTSTVVIHLVRNDVVAADNYYKECYSKDGYLNSPEGQFAGDLIEAYLKSSEEEITKLKKHRALTFLDNEVVKLVRSLGSPEKKSEGSVNDEDIDEDDPRRLL
eukprot:TRINITY_DN10991_c0_g1_i1.p1 TRINITY_DN10991_c0_g1~~TRINITY_DN10991_c0_g1_i1.p1  ORF type:complete len:306 (+),score=78.32 TRINITY_DN10991_c0_g1_i1:105-1022(+)